MKFIKIHDTDTGIEVRVNTDHIIFYVRYADKDITTVQTDGIPSVIHAQETPEEIDALIEQCIK